MEKITEGRKAAATPASSNGSLSEPLTPAALAKSTLRRLVMQRLDPTPANFARAWREEGGPETAEPLSGPAKSVVQQLSSRLAPAGGAREALSSSLTEALVNQRWEAVHRVLDTEVPSAGAQAQSWAELIERLIRQLERHQKQWTPARKKENLQHVLSSSRADVARLQQRLGQMLNSWESSGEEPALPGADNLADMEASDSSPMPVPVTAQLAAQPAASASPDSAAAPADARAGVDALAWTSVCDSLHGTLQTALAVGEPRAAEMGVRLEGLAARWTAEGAAPALSDEVRSACQEVARVLQHRHVLVDQMGTLVHGLTDSLGELAEDDSWVRGQCLAMRQHLDDGMSTRGVRAVTDLLSSTRARQAELRSERAQARDALKQMIHQMLQDIGELGTQTGHFNDKVERYAEVIGQADSLEGLAGVVREMVGETRSVHAQVTQTSLRLREEHSRATAMAERVQSLEAELRRLSDEVSTDQLTQVANRRGLIRDFEREQAIAQREAGVLSIGILDLDNFKKLNDSFGHQTGDEALKFLARRVTELVRPGDCLARYGGEEFVVLLPGTDTETAQQVLTRIQRQLSVELFMHEGKQTFVTFSAGVTLHRAGESLEASLQRADEALYEAKRTGKNRTCAA